MGEQHSQGDLISKCGALLLFFFYLNPPLYIPTNFKIFPPLSGLQPLYYFLYFHFFLPFSGPSTGSRLK